MRTTALAFLFLSAVLVTAQSSTELFISEYIEGTSNNKAIEIFNGTGAPINLATGGYNIQMFFNGNPAAGLTINLTGTVAAGDVYVIAQSSANATILAQADQTNGAGWFNGDDAVVLRKGTTIIDVVGQIGLDPGTEWGTGLTSTADNTLRRKLAITAGDTDGSNAFDPAVEWDGFATDTFGGLGCHTADPVCPAPPPPPAPLAQISEIQGTGLSSPLIGQSRRTEGNVVTAVFSNGFFIQDPTPDSDPNTSDGIFVFTSTAPTVQVGDEVIAQGMVAEFFSMTEIDANLVSVTGSGLALPAHITIDENTPSTTPPQSATLEPLEGMLVRVVNATATSPTDVFGEVSIVTRTASVFREPGILFPGLPGLPVFDGNPEVFEIDADRLSPTPRIPRGARIDLAQGPLAFSFGDYQIWPTALEFTGEPQVVPVRARTAGEFTVGSQNMLRLFDLVDDPAVSDEVPTPQVYQNRLSKLSQQVRIALAAPDIVAVQEVESLQALQDLAARIQADDPALVYTAFLLEGNDIGGIDVGFLVGNSVQVDSVTQFGKNDLFEFPGSAPALLNDRPPLVLRGTYVGNGAAFPFVVINVHQRSLGGIDDPLDGGRVRAKRNEQAVKLSDFIQSLQTTEPGIRLVVIGDFNAFEFTDGYVDVMGQVTGNPDPLGALIPAASNVSPILTNQTNNMPAEERYSFIFDGSAQSLDHALTTQALNPWVRGAQHARGNADAPNAFSTDPTTALRSADHDGTVVFIMSDFDADGVPDDQDNCRQAANANQSDADHDGIGDACDPFFEFGFAGLLAPYSPPPDVFRGNRSIPLKWQYTDINGNVTASAGANPTVNVSGPVNCGDTSGGEVVEVNAAGTSGYQYDAATATWQFNWKTTGIPAGCYFIQVTSPQAQPSPIFAIQLK
ncbi:MAG: lamin tail domain-containing protein [Acidobacteriales bacterium]|nr:lamin tail domain-containing protein [Terriglobales bacterium]